MGKLYTLDDKLLVGTPEVRIGDKIYPVDDRTKTVKKMVKLQEAGGDELELADQILKLALGEKAAKEIEGMELSLKAYLSLFELVTAAMTGEEPEAVAARFQEPGTDKQQ